MKYKRIAVFGGSQTFPGQPDYAAAQRLGHLLGAAGCTVLNGGYIGVMEAVSRGAAESGGHVIGVTCDQIESFRPVKANAWVQEELRLPTLSQRIMAMIEGCDAAIALPGGPGTLTEISLTWNHLLIGAVSPRPLILVGAGWKEVFDRLFVSLDGYIPEKQRRWLSFAENVEFAFEQLQSMSAVEGS